MGRKVPDAFKAQPRVRPHLLVVWDGFWELNTERQIGMVLGPIPGSAIRAYAHDAGLHGSAAETFRALIRALDADYLKRHSPKSGSRNG